MAFDEENMRIFMYSEDRADIGLENIIISAHFISYSDLKYNDATHILALNDFPCAFDELTLVRPSIFQNVTLFFNQDSVTQNFDVNDLAVRNDYENECDGLVVEFSIDGEPLPE